MRTKGLPVAFGVAVVMAMGPPGRAFAEPPVDAGAVEDGSVTPAPEPAPEPAPSPEPSLPPSSTPVVAPTPAAAAATATSHDAAEHESSALAWLGVPPMGSFQYATGVAEFGLVVGSWPGTGGFGTGFHYAERGGALAGLLLAMLGTAAEQSAAQQRANETGRTQYYHQYSPDEFGKTGMTIDAFSSQLGGDVTGFNLDLYMVRKRNEDAPLPWTIDWGINFHYLDGPDTMSVATAGGSTSDGHDTLGLGLLIGATLPLTRWAQGEVRLRPVLPIGGLAHNTWLTAELGLVGNVGNRLYVRGAFNAGITGDTGMMFGAGVRL